MPLFTINYEVAFYFITYLSIATIYYSIKGYRSNPLTFLFCIIILIVNILFHSFSPGYAPDKEIYELTYTRINNYHSLDQFNLGAGLYYLYVILDMISFPPSKLVVLHSSIINIGLLCLVFHRRVRDEAFLIMFLFSMSWFFVDMSVNSIRQGISSIFFLYFILNLSSGKKISSAFYAIIGFLFHWSMVVPLFIALCLYMIRKNRNYILFYICIFLFFLVSLCFKVLSIEYLIEIFSDFVNIDMLTLKVNSYYSHEYSTYSSSIFERISLLFEAISFAFIALVISYFGRSYYSINRENYIVNVFWILLLYSVLNLSMAHSYRNFYWAQLVFPLIVNQYLPDFKVRSTVSNQKFYLFLVFIIILISTFGLWRSGLVYALYN